MPQRLELLTQWLKKITDEETIKTAVTEAYYDYDADIWRASPFNISGYDPLGL